MGPGRELDALIAKTFDMPERKYSTRIQYAWIILERMQDKGWGIKMIYTQLAADWICNLSKPGEVVFFRANLDSYAICIASLRASGVAI